MTSSAPRERSATTSWGCTFAVLFFLVAYGYGILLNVGTVLLEVTSFRRYAHTTDIVRLLGWSMLENFGYRQLTVVWRLRGLVSYLKGSREWGAQERRGLSRPAG